MINQVILKKGDVVGIALAGTPLGVGFAIAAFELLEVDRRIRTLIASARAEGVEFSPRFKYDGRNVELTVATVSFGGAETVSIPNEVSEREDGEHAPHRLDENSPVIADVCQTKDGNSAGVDDSTGASVAAGAVVRKGPPILIVNGIPTGWVAPKDQSPVAGDDNSDSGKIPLAFNYHEYYLRDQKKNQHVSTEDSASAEKILPGTVMEVVEYVEQVVHILPLDEPDPQGELDFDVDDATKKEDDI